MATQAIAIKKKKSTSAIVRKVLLYVLLIIIGIIMVVPFLWMISTSLKEQYDTVKIPPVWIPNPPRWQNYVDLFTQQPMLQFMLNTIKIVFFVVLGQLFFSSLAAYSFARIKFKGRTVMFFFYIATLMVPGQVTMIPTYLMFAKVGLVDNHIVLILPAFFSAFGVFLLRQFFMSLPKELEEAAEIDGCNPFTTYYRIMPPFRTSKFSPFREANRKVNFCRFFKGSRRFSAVQKLSVHPPIVYAVLRKFTAFWRKLWRKFCAHIRGWPQPVQTPFRRTHSCCGCRHPR